MIKLMNKTNIKVLAVLFFVAGIFFHQVIIGDDLFLRGKETLEIDYKQEKLKTRVRFSVSPQK